MWNFKKLKKTENILLVAEAGVVRGGEMGKGGQNINFQL